MPPAAVFALPCRMDFQFWLFLIITVITLIARANSAAKKAAAERQRKAAEGRPGAETAPKSFEELLREIQSGKSQPTPAAPPVFETASYEEEDLEEYEYEKPAPVNYDPHKDDEIYSVYEKAKQEAFVRPSLEETLRLDQTDVSFGKFNEYRLKKKRAPVGLAYREIIRNPESFKKAFIVSEILQRRF